MSLRSNKSVHKGSSSRARFLFVRGMVLFGFSLLVTRLVYVQAILRTELSQKANRQLVAKKEGPAGRYRILDRNGLTLAETVQVQSCYVDPTQVKNKAALSKQLAALLRMSEATVSQKIRSAKGSFVWIRRNVEPAEAAAIRQRKWPGVGLKSEFRRNYPMGPIAPHLLGMVGYEGKGLSGIEMAFDKSLHMAANSTDGGDVKLALDAGLQQVVQRELEWGARKISAKRGMVLVQDPSNGDILAVASWPSVSLDPDNPPEPTELRVPPLVDVFEPGSTFKIVTAAAALEEQVVSPKDIFDGEKGAWKVHDITIHDHEPLKKMDFDEIMIHSSNIGTAKLAKMIGKEKMYQYSRLFGFGTFPGSGLSGEAKGVLRPLSKWSGVSPYVVSFGQEVAVTALQLIGSYSAVANGGTLMEPRFVQSIIDSDGHVSWHSDVAEVRRVVSPETARKVTDVLVKVVERGTGVNAQIQWDSSTKVAGKTGTAQKYDLAKRRYCDDLTLVSFCGYFPADKPKYTIAVLLDEPEGRRWGGLDAAPVFRRIAEQLAPTLRSSNPT